MIRRVTFDMSVGPTGRTVECVCEIDDDNVELISGAVECDDLDDVYQASREQLAEDLATERRQWRPPTMTQLTRCEEYEREA